MISGFSGEYWFLSNFSPSMVEYHNFVYPTVEHAYVAAKSHMPIPPMDLEWLCSLTPGKAKWVGRQLDLRPDWEEIKVPMMLELVTIKFATNDNLREKLLSTGNHGLYEENTWGDTFWGITPDRKGMNMLGKILMSVRRGLRHEISQKYG